MDKEIARLADSLGIKGREFNIIYELYIQNKKEEAINFVLEKTNCDRETAINIINGLMKDMTIPTQQQIAQVNLVAQEALNKPKCPICQSTNLSKISTTKKVAKIAAFGVFGMGDNGKTWKCNNCGSKF